MTNNNIIFILVTISVILYCLQFKNKNKFRKSLFQMKGIFFKFKIKFPQTNLKLCQIPFQVNLLMCLYWPTRINFFDGIKASFKFQNVSFSRTPRTIKFRQCESVIGDRESDIFQQVNRKASQFTSAKICFQIILREVELNLFINIMSF